MLKTFPSFLCLVGISTQNSSISHTFSNGISRDDTDAYQLVTWSKDQSLRIWKIEPSLQETVGQEFEDNEEDDSDEVEEAGAKGVEERRSLLPRSEEEKERSTTLESQNKYSEFDIIEMDDVKRIEEKEKRERELEESEAKEGKEAKVERKHSAKESGMVRLFRFHDALISVFKESVKSGQNRGPRQNSVLTVFFLCPL